MLTDVHFHLEFMKSSHPHMADSGPHLLTTLCYDHFIIVGNNLSHGCLLLRCAESTVLNIEHMWPQYTHNLRETGEGYSLVNVTGVGRRRTATSFDIIEGL